MRFKAILTVVLFAATSVVAQQAQHHNLEPVRQAILASENSEVVWIRVGDSRSSWRHWRGPGEFFRQFDVKHAALVCPAVAAFNGGRDGLGQLPIALEGIGAVVGPPGFTFAASGFVNTLPSDVLETWTTGPTTTPQFARFAIVYSTSGAAMDSTPLDASTGGTFRRGDPAQGRNIQSVERLAITDARLPVVWLPSVLNFGYDPFASIATYTQRYESPPPAGATGTVRMTPFRATLPATTGAGITLWHSHDSPPAIGTGHLTCATRIDFAGASGMVFGVIAQGGWSTTDHMARVVSGMPDNPDAKYTDQGLREWLSVAYRAAGKRVVFEVDLGTNQSDGPFIEWNGLSSNAYRDNIRRVAQRLFDAATDVGAAQVTILLDAPWSAPGDWQRINAYRADLRSLAIEQGWSYYDQEGELRDRGYSDGGSLGLNSIYREDLVHQNFAGMNLLGQVKWSVLSTPPVPACDTIDFNNDGLFPSDDDLVDFLAVSAGGPCSNGNDCNDIDFNNDGLFPDDADVVAFFNVLAGGAC